MYIWLVKDCWWCIVMDSDKLFEWFLKNVNLLMNLFLIDIIMNVIIDIKLKRLIRI